MLKRILTIAAVAAGGAVIAKQIKQRLERGNTSSVTEWIEVAVPVSTAYNQWTQFEEFPQFMDNVHEVRQLDDRRLLWRADVGGRQQEWEAEITEQVPDMRIAWRSITGAHNAGVVSFHHISDTTTRVTLQLDYRPEGLVETVGDLFGTMRFEAQRNLRNFKQFIEARGHESGEWRGTVVQQH